MAAVPIGVSTWVARHRRVIARVLVSARSVLSPVLIWLWLLILEPLFRAMDDLIDEPMRLPESR